MVVKVAEIVILLELKLQNLNYNQLQFYHDNLIVTHATIIVHPFDFLFVNSIRPIVVPISWDWHRFRLYLLLFLFCFALFLWNIRIQLGPGQTIVVPGRFRVPVWANGVTSTLNVIVQRRTDNAISQRRIYIRAKSEVITLIHIQYIIT